MADGEKVPPDCISRSAEMPPILYFSRRKNIREKTRSGNISRHDIRVTFAFRLHDRLERVRVNKISTPGRFHWLHYTHKSRDAPFNFLHAMTRINGIDYNDR